LERVLRSRRIPPLGNERETWGGPKGLSLHHGTSEAMERECLLRERRLAMAMKGVPNYERMGRGDLLDPCEPKTGDDG
jgi:hypothetical protein